MRRGQPFECMAAAKFVSITCLENRCQEYGAVFAPDKQITHLYGVMKNSIWTQV